MMLIIAPIVSTSNKNNVTFLNENNQYAGEKFPTEYLYPDYKGFTVYDIDYYLLASKRIIGYFSKFPNDTNVNTATGVFYVKGKAFPDLSASTLF